MDNAYFSLTTIFSWMLRVSAQGALLVVLILAVQLLLRKRLAARWRYALWTVLVIRLLLVWTPSSPLSLYNMAPAELAPPAFEEAPAMIAEALPPLSGLMVDPKMIAAESEMTEEGIVLHAVYREIGGWRSLCAKTWLAGFAALIFSMILQSWRFTRNVRQGMPVTDKTALELLEECRAKLNVRAWLVMVETDYVRSPALLGCIRPRLLLPTGFLNKIDSTEMSHVLLHELAHIKRGDIWVSWLINLLTAAHWFNPLIWLARKRIIVDREAACDAQVLATLDEKGQRQYGHTILDLMKRFSNTQWAPGIAGISESNSNLKRRIIMIKQYKKPTWIAAGVGLGLCLILGIVTLTNAQTKPENVDFYLNASDIFAYTDSTGETWLAVQVTNPGAQDIEARVIFLRQSVESTGATLYLENVVPAGKTITFNNEYPFENGTHTVTAVVMPLNAEMDSNKENNRAETTLIFKDGHFSKPAAQRNGRSGLAAAMQHMGGSGRRTSIMDANSDIVEKFDQLEKDSKTAREQCQINLKRMGLAFKMYASESEREIWPPLCDQPNTLMFQWEEAGKENSIKDYLEHTKGEVNCPLSGMEDAVPEDTDYCYLGYVLQSDEDALNFFNEFMFNARSKEGKVIYWETFGKRRDGIGYSTDPNVEPLFRRLQEGVERFLITDINNPAAGAVTQSKIPVVIEWPDRHQLDGGGMGGSILYMDGHVEFVRYPGKWPMTEKTIGMLCTMADRAPIQTIEN